jgi:hypothetical protein
MAESFVQVPPQSTGRRVSTTSRTNLVFINQVDVFRVGDTVSGVNSAATGIITSIGTEEFEIGSGRLWFSDISGEFSNGEFLQVDSITRATSSITVQEPSQEFDYQNIVISDPDNPSYKQKIDSFGATVNTFSEGSPQFDAFGSLRVNEVTKLADYRPDQGDPSEFFWIRTASGGSSSHSAVQSMTTLATTDAINSQSTFTSNRYHTYFPGYGTLAEFTVLHGDMGKTGNRREWGMHDDSNGMFFRLDDTVLQIVVRTSTSGSATETVVNQADWNGNKLDGSGANDFLIDLTKVNLFWIDFQWLGSGKIRFGIYDDAGTRTVLHTFNNANINVVPYMQSGTLPLRFENINTAGTISVSELKWICASVKTEGPIDRAFTQHAGAEVDARVMDEYGVIESTVNAAGSGYAVNDVLTISGGTGTAATYTVTSVGGSGEVQAVERTTYGSYTASPPTPATTTVAPAGGTGCTLNLKNTTVPTPILSVRAATIVGGVTNRLHIIPTLLNLHVENGPVHVHVRENNTITGATWTAGTISGVEYDIDATGFDLGGKSVWAGTLSTGTHNIDMLRVYDLTSNVLRLNADGVTQDQNITVIARSIYDSTVAAPIIWATWQWQEI